MIVTLLEVRDSECRAGVEQLFDGVTARRHTNGLESCSFACVDIERRVANDKNV